MNLMERKEDRLRLADLIEEVLTDHEPNWKTHSMSKWNILRRYMHNLRTGGEISTALSWNTVSGEWEL